MLLFFYKQFGVRDLFVALSINELTQYLPQKPGIIPAITDNYKLLSNTSTRFLVYHSMAPISMEICRAAAAGKELIKK